MRLLITPGSAALTARQLDMVEFIREHIEEHGWAPSVREIGERVGLTSTSSVHRQLIQLEKRGVLVRGERRSRAMVLTEAA